LIKSINLKDKKTDIALLGGPFLFFNFTLISIFFLIYPENILMGDYFKNFFIDQNSISSRELLFFILLPTLFFFMGIYDDKFNLHANYRLIISFSIIFIFLLIDDNFIIKTIKINDKVQLDLYELSIIFTIICVTGLIFAFNMYDGINLQFGIHLLIVFLFFIHKGILFNFFLIFTILILIFLFLNFTNKIYMGDSGVYFLGALVSIIFLKNYNNGTLNILEIITLSLIPILDMFRVIFTRVLNGIHPFKKDNLHLHYLLKKKFSKKKYLWQAGSFLTILNILLIEIYFKTYFILMFFILIYILLIAYLNLSKKK
tara:strand:- start:114 stop:1058 length:945 start_codon:yes stop_codon:yes gene_type:complete